MCTNLQKRVLALERAQDEREIDISFGLLMSNDTNLEERVQALEFQMESVHEDMTVIQGGRFYVFTPWDVNLQLPVISRWVLRSVPVISKSYLQFTSLLMYCTVYVYMKLSGIEA